ncbi:MAG TPA: DUF1493 family protein [Candidatus Sulfopaludibacter sp.]|jgi:hypothetical protein|nr:DUF1493 family protein [Candidatus Sulfopaludibacter sp.]
MTELEERIVNFIVDETSINAKKVHLDSRLAQDIGMEGDDAVEFFENFHEHFHVDLSALGDHWHQHFLPEGIGVPPLGCMVMIGVGVVAGGLLHDLFKWIPYWAAMIVLVAIFCSIYTWIYGKFFGEPQDQKIPITVRDLVEAASSGTWVKHYDSSHSPQ